MIQKIPIRFDYYQYAIETWVEIFKEFEFKDVKNITDLCMGWAPKVELALIKTNFEGRLIAIDNSKKNMKILLNLINQFNFKYSIKTKCLNILNPVKNIKTDILVANHIIDDLFLYLFLGNEKKVYDLFSQPENLKKIWLKIINDKNIYQKIYDGLREFILNTLVDSGLLIIAQYTGYQEKLYNLEFASNFCKKFLQKLNDDLINNYRFISIEKPLTSAFNNFQDPYFMKDEVFILKRT